MSQATATEPYKLWSNFSSAGNEPSPYIMAALVKRNSLINLVKSAFAHAAMKPSDIRPVFRAAASPLNPLMDRISNTGMGMGFLARVINNSAGNNLLQKIKRAGRIFRSEQLKRIYPK